MKRRYFGTDGVRGRVDGAVVNADFFARLGVAAGTWFGGRGEALIGWDTRASGPELAEGVARGLAAAGLSSHLAGVVPTPAIARAASQRGMLGVMITASHNPATDNGIKFFHANGTKLSDEEEGAIEALVPEAAPAVGATKVPVWTEVLGDYLAACAALLPAGALAGWKLVVDTAHGATCGSTPEVLRGLGAEVIGLGDAPDGTNINAGVGSEHPESLGEAVRRHGARLGLAHDGDGDRVVFCDESGALVAGDEILGLLGLQARRDGRLAADTLVVTVQSNLGVDAALAAVGAKVERTPVGDRHVAARMRELGAMLGGESSGHIICAEHADTGDGLVAALQVLAVMHRSGQSLGALRRQVSLFPQRSGTVTVTERRPLENCATLQDAMRRIEASLGARGRLLVRYSGTEPKLRLLVEGPDEAAVRAAYAELDGAARADLTVAEER